ncbi:MAG: 50S ribosomal protein L28 [Bacteroidia bacterium]|nr:50S ribosomal protein L28 [Bacteroidia bacterium]
MRVCEVTGKRPVKGYNVSHSNRHTLRRFNPNLHVKRFYVPEEDRWVTMKVSAHGLRIIQKKGIYAVLKDLRSKGTKI